MDSHGLKVMLLMVLMGGFSVSFGELLRPPQPPQHNYAFNKFRPPPPTEPSFIQRITSWFFPWGGVSSEEEFHMPPASPKIDNGNQQRPTQQTYGVPQQQSYGVPNQHQHAQQQQQFPHQTYGVPQPTYGIPNRVRDTEPTTARTTQPTPATKCSPCNKVPWIPMMPTYQLPVVKPDGQHQVYFKHHFGNENPYAQVPAEPGYKYGVPGSASPTAQSGYKYEAPTSTQPPLTTPLKFQDGNDLQSNQLYGSFQANQGYKYVAPGVAQQPGYTYGAPGHAAPPVNSGYNYAAPTSAQPPLTTPIKFQQGNNLQGNQFYGVPPIKNVQFQGYQYSTPAPIQPRVSTIRPNTNTIDTSVVTFTTNRPQNNRPSRFTALGSITNPEYLPPPNILPLEGENSNFVPIPIPNLSPTPIPPLFDAKNFLNNPYSQKTGFIKLVPLDPVAQVSNNVNVQVKPETKLPEFEAINENPVEVVSSNLVAEFTIGPDATPFVPRQPLLQNFGFNIDVGNNLDANTTINSPIVVESLETATDTVGAGSEHDYEHNVHQGLESSINQLKSSEDNLQRGQETDREPYLEDSEESTTTEGNYIVRFEPSIQTAADLAEKAPKKNKSEPLKKNRDRPTPIELLDSPILHITTFTARPTTTAFTEPPPPFKPMEDFTKKLATLWTSSPPASTSTEPTPTPTYRTTATSPTTTEAATTSDLPPAPTTTMSYFARLSGGAFAGITPPRQPTKPPPSTKKPKQIQIVIPYKTFNKPSPFKVQEEQELITYRPIRGHYVTMPSKEKPRNEIKNLKLEENFNAHGYHNDQEFPDHAQESKIVESKVTIEPPRTTKYLTKILANNIRDLLKKEKTPKPPRIDLMKLQKNIDGWTEQSFLGKASTITLTGHTKAIPRAFLSTTMRATTLQTIPSTTAMPRTTFDPDLMEETKRQYDSILYKKADEGLYVKRHDRFLDRDNELVLLNNNLTFNTLHEGVKVFAPKTTMTPKELWKRLHVTVSPLTNERIYVVTPLPREELLEQDAVSTFRPRFAVRPTVAGEFELSR